MGFSGFRFANLALFPITENPPNPIADKRPPATDALAGRILKILILTKTRSASGHLSFLTTLSSLLKMLPPPGFHYHRLAAGVQDADA